MKNKYSLSLVAALMICGSLFAQNIERVEPPCWWVGMKNSLQLMIYGEDLQGSTVTLDKEVRDIIIGDVYDGDSPDYLFVDVRMGLFVSPCDVVFHVNTPSGKKLDFTYSFKKRAEGSSSRHSFSSADAVYLIVPDRFANGDESNDNVSDAVERCDRMLDDGRHGGDIQGMIDHLDYLYSLGVTAIWSTPLLFDNEKRASYHGYACADYYRIDPRYGTNELFKNYVEKAHEYGIKVIMDMVPNHCGTAHWWMDNLPFRDWLSSPAEPFVRTNGAMSTQFDPHASVADKKACTGGWFDTVMPDLNLSNKYVRKYLSQVAIWWMEYSGMDGLRVDTFPYSDKDAMAQWVESVRNEYPKINIVAECWFSDAASCSYWEGRKQFDGYNSNLPSIMDFPLREAIVSGFKSKSSTPMWNEGLVKVYNSISQDFVYKNPGSMMILAANHDTKRPATEFDRDWDVMKNVVTLLCTMRGMPQFLYGDEVGIMPIPGRDSDGDRRVDFPGGWRGDAIDLFDESSRQGGERDLFDYMSKLLTWRKDSKVVTEGKLLHFRPKNDNVYVYFRYTEPTLFSKMEVVMVVINNGDKDYSVEWDRFSEITSKFAADGKDVISGKRIMVDKPLNVGAHSSVVIEFKK